MGINQPITHVCSKCGSKNVTLDIVAEWNEQSQEWQAVKYARHTDCQNCYSTTELHVQVIT